MMVTTKTLKRVAIGIGATVTAATTALGLYRVYQSFCVEEEAARAVRALDIIPRDDVEEIIAPDRNPAPAQGPRPRFRPSNIKVMALGLADEAYNKFGYRPRTPPNLLITRKWMLDQLSAFPDLRAADSARVIDMALYDSFMPTRELQERNLIDGTQTYRMRGQSVPVSGGFWDLLPYGRTIVAPFLGLEPLGPLGAQVGTA